MPATTIRAARAVGCVSVLATVVARIRWPVASVRWRVASIGGRVTGAFRCITLTSLVTGTACPVRRARAVASRLRRVAGTVAVASRLRRVAGTVAVARLVAVTASIAHRIGNNRPEFVELAVLEGGDQSLDGRDFLRSRFEQFLDSLALGLCHERTVLDRVDGRLGDAVDCHRQFDSRTVPEIEGDRPVRVGFVDAGAVNRDGRVCDGGVVFGHRDGDCAVVERRVVSDRDIGLVVVGIVIIVVGLGFVVGVIAVVRIILGPIVT